MLERVLNGLRVSVFTLHLSFLCVLLYFSGFGKLSDKSDSVGIAF